MMMMAFANGKIELIKYLIGFGIEINMVKTWRGMKLLDIANETENQTLIQLIKSYSANPIQIRMDLRKELQSRFQFKGGKEIKLAITCEGKGTEIHSFWTPFTLTEFSQTIKTLTNFIGHAKLEYKSKEYDAFLSVQTLDDLEKPPNNIKVSEMPATWILPSHGVWFKNNPSNKHQSLLIQILDI